MIFNKFKKVMVPLLFAAIASISSFSSNAQSNPFGILVNAVGDGQRLDIQTKIKLAKSLGVQYIRMLVVMQDYHGNIEGYNAYVNAGFKIILNVNWAAEAMHMGQGAPFPTDMNAYSQQLNAILDKYKPELVVIENEENNIGYHSGDAQQYLTELQTAVQICHSKGLKVTNGGVMAPQIKWLIYQEMMSKRENPKANEFYARAIPDEYRTVKNRPGQQKSIELAKQMLEGYKNIDIDYVNFHWYEPAKFEGIQDKEAKVQAVNGMDNVDMRALGETVDFLKRVTGKQPITNEIGQYNQSGGLVTQMLSTLVSLHLPYVIWYSGDGGLGKALALNNADGSLRPNGQAFQQFIAKQFGNR